MSPDLLDLMTPEERIDRLVALLESSHQLTLKAIDQKDELAEQLATLKRIADALDKIAGATEQEAETNSYMAALENWRHGGGKHPDD